MEGIQQLLLVSSERRSQEAHREFADLKCCMANRIRQELLDDFHENCHPAEAAHCGFIDPSVDVWIFTDPSTSAECINSHAK